jgi:hypothetical protein
VSGCALAEEPEPLVSGAAVPPPSAEAQQLILPFDAYELSRGEYYAIRNAQDILMRACMRNHGHDWDTIERPVKLPETKNRRRYGVVEAAVAQQFGYHVPQGLLNPTDVTEEEAERDSKLSPEQREAAYGQKVGCSARAQTQIMKGSHADYEKYNNLGEVIFDRSRKAPAVNQAMQAWSDCMRKKGFTYSDPLQALGDARWWESETDPPSRNEISAAVTDEACKRETRLVPVWFSTEKRMQLKALDENAAYFRSLKNAKSRQLSEARKIYMNSL